jgi:hypothetical protein
MTMDDGHRASAALQRGKVAGESTGNGVTSAAEYSLDPLRSKTL